MTPFYAALPFACLLAFASWTDIKSRRIPNLVSAITFLLGMAWAVNSPGWEPSLYHLAHFGVALLIGMALFGLGFWGGGDGKFYAAVAAWFALPDFFRLMFMISLSGLLLLLVMFGMRKFGRLEKGAGSVPYGVAISAGAFATFCFVHFRAGLW
ncbi:prepilin peptidase [Pontixanthobacter gangjinensis]|uniref:Peptidase A24 n=1 Tax=Pontixanthobacter gangjinensis TaxID=1028742 RepID=A0A6I4SI69_9SPHN|nr:prepilin peptidase [Pontixanthobacter gangjinensis]MXO55255.1 peptidase A24 [Pontixanthobacter gangjinensis]